jgi:hypothetical protein
MRRWIIAATLAVVSVLAGPGVGTAAVDYFHPSLSGQAALASISWASSWWA